MPESSRPRPPSEQMKPHGRALSRYGTALRPVWPAVHRTLRSVSSSIANAIESVQTIARPSALVAMTVRLVTSAAARCGGSRSSSRRAASRTGWPGSTPTTRAGSLTRLTTPCSQVSTPFPSSTVMTSTVAAGMPRAS